MLSANLSPSRAGYGANVVVSTTASDSHTWNLVYLQLLLEELGHSVVNLGSCVPDATLVDGCCRIRPDLLVLSSVNGHGRNDALRVVPLLRERWELRDLEIVIGGKLGIDGTQSVEERRRLLDAGVSKVFADDDIDAFRTYLRRFSRRAVS